MNKGRFISIEGGEGVGKSTQIRALQSALENSGAKVIVTREPGGTEGAESIRSLILDGSAEKWGARAEALLFAAARADHVEKLILPALQSGTWVISDRFVDSSRAYQSGGSGLDDADIMAIHNVGSDGILPDRTFILMLDDTEANARAAARDGAQADRIQSRDDAFHKQVHDAFKSYAHKEQERVRIIDASGSEDEVTRRLLNEISDLLP